jgi:hypothetical protein
MKYLIHSTQAAGHYRAGMAFGAQAVLLSQAEFTAQQWAQILADPWLVVTPADAQAAPVDENPPSPAPSSEQSSEPSSEPSSEQSSEQPSEQSSEQSSDTENASAPDVSANAVADFSSLINAIEPALEGKPASPAKPKAK